MVGQEVWGLFKVCQGNGLPLRLGEEQLPGRVSVKGKLDAMEERRRCKFEAESQFPRGRRSLERGAVRSPPPAAGHRARVSQSDGDEWTQALRGREGTALRFVLPSLPASTSSGDSVGGAVSAGGFQRLTRQPLRPSPGSWSRRGDVWISQF